jgi:tRNA A-37 threonylcarbamoyl transferase component Bud32
MTKDPLLGRRLGNYQLERPLGHGGMAQVYYGQDVKLRRSAAIKIIDARYRDKPAYAERFVREAQAIATWRHENIIQIYYADDEEGLYYFAMEYIDGVDLGTLLAEYKQKGEKMPHEETLRIGRAVASALDYAHKRGIIHRDIKPSNVLVDRDGRVVLADFGLAMDVEQGSVGEVLGSAHYVAPEQARHSANAVPQSDLYSLGVVLYEILTGQVPFDDPSSSTAVALQHVTMPPPPPREINPDLSVETEAVLLKALSKAPADRYQTGRELINALEKSIQSSQVTQPSAPPKPTSAQPLPAATFKAPPPPAEPARPAPAVAAGGINPLIYAVGGGGAVLLLVIILFLAGVFGGGDKDTNEAAAGQTPTAAEATAGGKEGTPEPPTENTPAAAGAVVVTQSGSLSGGAATPVEIAPVTPTPNPEPTVLADTLLDFSGPDGKWEYLWARPGEYNWAEMAYESRRYENGAACWYSQDYVRICQDGGQPGNNFDIAWRWTSDVSGPLQIDISARKLEFGGDGVRILVQHQTTDNILYPIYAQDLSGGDGQGFRITLNEITAIKPGDTVLFVINKLGNVEHDRTILRGTICHYSCP